MFKKQSKKSEPTTKDIMDLYGKYVLNTYKKTPIVLEKGKGTYVWDADGKKYLDFFPGWAVSGIGHCHPRVVNAVKEQLKNIIHVSNNFYSRNQALLAEKISNTSFKSKVFFANSGAEANEGAIKLARAYGSRNGRYKIITMEKSFHGRTLATLTATAQQKVQKGFEPLPEGFAYVPFNDIEALIKAADEKTVAVMLEPIQGEGGINIAADEYMRDIRKLCDEKDMLLILDEVQTCMGRTGKIYAFEHYNIKPDIMTLAKALGGGLPIGAVVISERLSDVMGPGMHGSTFGGSPIVCAAALAVFEAIEKEELLKNAKSAGALIVKYLNNFHKMFYNIIKEIRHKGLMIGLELKIDGTEIAGECMSRGLLINCTQSTVLRIMPPITVDAREISHAMKVLESALRKASINNKTK